MIDQYNLRGTPEGKKYGFHIIGWTIKSKDDKNKVCLEDIFHRCHDSSTIGKNDYSTLSEFLAFGCRDESMTECKSVVVNIFVCLLRMLGKTTEDDRYFTKTSLYRKIKNSDDEIEKEYREFVYQAVVLLYNKQYVACYDVIVNYLKGSFTQLFTISKGNTVLANFCGKSFDFSLLSHNVGELYSDIQIGSVHSAKGQTHCATMYVETFYSGYECDHLFKIKSKATKRRAEVYYPNPLFQEEHTCNQLIYTSVLRMMYVGFSRPTHLLCFAVHKHNWNDEKIKKMRELGWNVVLVD